MTQAPLFTAPNSNADQQDLSAKAVELHNKLLKIHGHSPWKSWGKPMEVLLSTILSQRTTYHKQRKAYRALFKAFPSFDEIRQAPVEQIEACITPVTFAPRKAPTIKLALNHIFETQGALTLDFLARKEIPDAMDWLTGIKGVGVKTASCVLMFSLKMPVLPVDTHVYRVSQRWGLLHAKTNPTQAHHVLNDLFPKEIDVVYNFHMNAFKHGQKTCTFYSPKCTECALAKQCDWHQKAKERG